ncbi:Smr/MutS family protein [Lacinutrix salivirga]
MFKIGDTVSVLDEDLSGIISSIEGHTVTLETKDGFMLKFEANELVKIKSDNLRHQLFSSATVDQVISEKEEPKKHFQPKVKAKERYEPTMEVDLHIHQLTTSSKGMTNHDMLTLQLETARHKLEFAMQKRIQKIVFIHGKGEGVLKMELEYLFGRYNNVKFYDANYQKYGLGATEVYILQSVKPN